MSTVTSDVKERKTLVAVVQMNCKSNKDDNWRMASELIKSASGYGARMAFLPECFDMVCESRSQTLENLEPINGPLITKYRQLASDHKIWLSLGGLHETGPDGAEGKARNAHIVINDEGNIVSVYHKIHLFNLEIPGVVRLIESEFSVAGQRLEPPVMTPAGAVGLGICYDVRFPEMSIALAKSGADILTYPSAFTVATGMDHWSTLLRSRAIENQCYVVAAAQTGVHNQKRSSYGHSMIIDPWGAIVAQCSEGPALALAVIDSDVLKSARSKLPVWTDRRPDVYGELQLPSVLNTIDSVDDYPFGGSVRIRSSFVFYKTNLTYAFVNHRPVLPGHVLIAPLRPSAQRLTQLNQSEVTDLFSTLQKVQRAVESEYGATSSTIAIQDGPDAGQSINHLHIHVLPRKPTDFGGNIDQIYQELQTHDKESSGTKKGVLRSTDEMTSDSLRLRKYF